MVGIRALNDGPSPGIESKLWIADGRLEVDVGARSVRADAEPLDVEGVKFDLLCLLAQSADNVVSLPRICQRVWGEDGAKTENTARMHISNLRKVLGPDLGDPRTGAILTRPRLGYQAVSSLDGKAQHTNHGDDHPVHVIADGRIIVDPESLTVVSDGRLINDITRLEFQLLAELARRPDRIVGLPALLMGIWNCYDGSARATVQAHVSNIRRRLGSELGDRRLGAIRTVRTIADLGYYTVRSLEE